MDTLVSLGTLAAYLFSLVTLVAGTVAGGGHDLQLHGNLPKAVRSQLEVVQADLLVHVVDGMIMIIMIALVVLAANPHHLLKKNLKMGRSK